MRKVNSSVSKADSYQGIGEYWDTHDLGDVWEQTNPAQFEVEIQTEATYYAVEPNLAMRISNIARERGVSSETLLNLWLQEKLNEEIPVK